jgi:hypothetical protein
MKRISRGTPYILTVDDWRDQNDRVKVKQLVDFQNSGAFAATLATAAKAISDLEEVAFPVISPSVDEELRAALDLLNEQVQKHDALLTKASK